MINCNFFEDILPQLVWERICLTCLRIDRSLPLNLKMENNRIPWISGYQDFIAKGGDKNTLLMKPLSPINVSQYLKWKKTHIKTWCFFSAFFCLARFVKERGGDPLYSFCQQFEINKITNTTEPCTCKRDSDDLIYHSERPSKKSMATATLLSHTVDASEIWRKNSWDKEKNCQFEYVWFYHMKWFPDRFHPKRSGAFENNLWIEICCMLIFKLGMLRWSTKPSSRHLSGLYLTIFYVNLGLENLATLLKENISSREIGFLSYI